MSSFQAFGPAQGRQFAEQCDLLLDQHGYTRLGRRVVEHVGVEVDQEAVSSDGGLVWFEYKGSLQGSRPGLLRTDTLKKAIANGALLGAVPEHPPYVVLTSHVPTSGAGAEMLETALHLGLLDAVVCVYDPAQLARLRDLASCRDRLSADAPFPADERRTDATGPRGQDPLPLDG